MDYNQILNAVVAGVICSAILTFVSFIFKIVKKKYNEDSALFHIKISFFLGLIGVAVGPLSLFLEEVFIPKGILIICFIVNSVSTISGFYEAIKYNNNSR